MRLAGERHWPFVRCMFHWEDTWDPYPADSHHWCARPPDHDGDHEGTDGARRKA